MSRMSRVIRGPVRAALELERALARALRQPDSEAAIARLAADRRLAPVHRRLLGAADVAGFRVSYLLVARLRFERLIRGSRAAAAWFARDPAGFAHQFRSYHARVAPRALDPASEGRAFDRFCAREARRTAPSGSPR